MRVLRLNRLKMYLAANIPQAAVLAPTAQTFREFLEFQEIWVFFITIYVIRVHEEMVDFEVYRTAADRAAPLGAEDLELQPAS